MQATKAVARWEEGSVFMVDFLFLLKMAFLKVEMTVISVILLLHAYCHWQPEKMKLIVRNVL